MVAPEDGSYCVLSAALSPGPLAISSPRVDVHEDRDMSNDLVFAGGNLTTLTGNWNSLKWVKVRNLIVPRHDIP